MATEYVKVGTHQKFETYALNGELSSVGEAIERFFHNDVPTDYSFSLNGDPIELDDSDGGAHTLRGGDVILCLPSGIAKGGVKGAST